MTPCMLKRITIYLLLFFSLSFSVWAEEVALSSLNSAQEQEILDFIAKKYPEKYEMILPLKEKEPALYQKVLASYQKIKQEQESIKKNHPKAIKGTQTPKGPQSTDAQITPEQEQAILEFMSLELPEQKAIPASAVQALKEQDPAYYQQQLNIFKRIKESHENLKKNYPEAFEHLQALKRDAAINVQISPKEEQAILEFLRAEFPELYKVAQDAKGKEPAHYQKLLNTYKRMKGSHDNLKKNNPEAFEHLQALKRDAAINVQISPKEEQALLEYIFAEHPENSKNIQTLKEKDPARYQQQLNAYKRMKESYENLKNNNPEVYERSQALKNAS